ncbi:hypothetical protein BH09BAC3_BH09BAC3_23700 [soil metagenome]
MFGATTLVEAQVIFGIGPQQSTKSWRLMSITINLDKNSNMNMLVNGRGGNSLVIDVNALRHPEKVYSYSELAEKIYTPGPTYIPSAAPVPYFLMAQPMPTIKVPENNVSRIYRRL